MVDLPTIITAAKEAKELVSWKTIQRNILNRTIKGEMIIPIFGAGGVGKTTLSRLLTGENPLDLMTTYERSLQTETQKLTGKEPVRLLVAPGQKTYADNWQEIVDLAAKGRRVNVINVVAYGYHSLGVDHKYRHASFKNERNGRIEKFLSENRINELVRAQQMIELISTINKPFSITTLIAKQDLWFDKSEEVINHYAEGEYHNLMKSASNAHHIIPVSLGCANLATEKNEILAKTVKGYDFITFLHYVNAMTSQITKLTEV